MAKIICRRRPNQNPGSEMPIIDTVAVTRSNQRPRRTADQMPTGTVSRIAQASETPINSKVAGTRSRTRVSTGLPSLKLYPQSPATKAASHDQYLLPQRSIEPERAAQPLDVLGADVGVGQVDRQRPARCRVDQQEDERRDQKEQRDGVGETTCEQTGHGRQLI